MWTLWQDLKYAARMLAKNPGFTAIAIVTLALGIGANTAIFSVVNGVLLHSMPYGDPARLAIIWNDYGSEGQSLPSVSAPDFKDYRERARTMEVAAATGTGGGTLQFDEPGGGSRPRQFDMATVTTNFFPLFGVTPMLGRNFNDEEGSLNGPPVVIMSYNLWRRSFHSDPQLVGKSIQLNGQTGTVIGILPPQFKLLLPAEALSLKDSDLWVPQRINYALPPRNLTFLTVFARLNPGVNFAQAQAEMDRIAEQLRNENEIHKQSGMRIRVIPMQFDVVKNVRATLLTLLGAVAFVLLIACGNVANLLLARATSREREMAIRCALGASRARLVRQIFTESLLLAIVGGLAGLVLSSWGLDLLLVLRPAGLPRVDEIHIDKAVLGFSLSACLLTALLFGLMPAMQGARLNLNDTLKEGTKGMGASQGQSARRLLVVSEFALALVLLIGAGLLIRSFIALQRVQPGYNSQNITTFRLTIPFNRFPQNDDRLRFIRELEQKLAALPGVQSVGSINQLPLTGSGSQMPYAYNAETSQKWESVSADWRPITPGFLPTIGARLLAGRFFTDADDANHPLVTIVDETLARKAWPGESAIGKKLEVELLSQRNNPRVQSIVVGVVAHLRIHDLTRDVREEIYVPEAQETFNSIGVAVKSTGDVGSMRRQVEEVVRSLEPTIALRDLKQMDDYVDDARAPMRFNLILIGIFGVIALALASVGLYGVMAYTVSQRAHELGIRMALGAAPRDVLRLVLSQGVRLTILGAGLGLLASLLLTRALANLLFGVSATDPLTFAAVVLLLVAVALTACYIPARRAMRIDPMVALRYE
ncbi:MAG: ABC transporter permease [Candidatus Acidiferrales bacterium]